MAMSLMIFSLLAALCTSLVYADDAMITQLSAKLGVTGSNIEPAPVAEMKPVLTNSDVLYVTTDGKHIIQEQMDDVSSIQPVNINNKLLINNLITLEKEMIVYKAAQEKHVITIFTDITCYYCHKLHEQIKDYNALGITVRYLAFQKESLQNQPKLDMKAIWCAKNRNKAFDDAMNGKSIQSPASCDIDISSHYALGVQFGVSGTPAIVLSNGYVVLGYLKPQEMKSFLDLHQN